MVMRCLSHDWPPDWFVPYDEPQYAARPLSGFLVLQNARKFAAAIRGLRRPDDSVRCALERPILLLAVPAHPRPALAARPPAPRTTRHPRGTQPIRCRAPVEALPPEHQEP